jgi:general secretion pathway protein C
MLQISPASRSANLWPGVSAALVGCAAAASVVFWVLNFPAGSAVQGVPLVQSSAQAVTSSFSSYLARAWGVQAALPQVPTQNSAQYKLMGVIASVTGQGSALIAVDGLPPKAFRVGEDVNQGVQLVSLTPKQARLKSNGQDLVLELPGSEAP